MIIALVVIWLAVGASGFVFWWTSEYDLTLSDAMLIPIEAPLGPITWIAGYFLHADIGESRPSRILVKRR